MNMSSLASLDRLETTLAGVARDTSKLNQETNNFWFFRLRLLFLIRTLRFRNARLSRALGNLQIQTEPHFQKMKEVAIGLDDMVKNLYEALNLYKNVSNNKWLCRVTKRQMEELLCEMEDLLETATLASKKEFHEVTSKIIDSHLKSSK